MFLLIRQITKSVLPSKIRLRNKCSSKTVRKIVSNKIVSNKLGFENGFEVPRTGLGGGIMVLWKDNVEVTYLTSSVNQLITSAVF